MKKITWIEIIVVLALVAGWFYMEKTESLTIFVKEDMTKEEILAEMPEIAVTEQDEKLEDYVMGLPEVQAALAAEKETIFTKEEGAALLEEYLMEGRELAEFSVSDGVSVVFRDAEHRETAYTFDEGYLSKEISVYEKHPGRNWDCVAIYKNLNGNYEKVDGIPQWFSWRQLRNEA